MLNAVTKSKDNTLSTTKIETEAVAEGGPSCASECEGLGFTGGYVKGTAPFCGADCSDCGGDYCGSEHTEFSDGGHKCSSGTKQCCCEGHSSFIEMLKAVTKSKNDTMTITKMEAEVVAEGGPSCASECKGLGFTGGYVKGTAPLCGADCSDCGGDYCGSEHTEFSDGGHKCHSGTKQCCCEGSSSLMV
jgi:hypothetical protein